MFHRPTSVSDLLRYFLAAWRFARAIRFVPEAEADGAWTPGDAAALQNFFAGPTGQKLKHRLTNYVLKSALAANRQATEHAYHAGRASGVADGIVALEAHLPQPISLAAAQSGNSEEADQAAAAFFDEYAA